MNKLRIVAAVKFRRRLLAYLGKSDGNGMVIGRAGTQILLDHREIGLDLRDEC
jgi:hypothetical protein